MRRLKRLLLCGFIFLGFVLLAGCRPTEKVSSHQSTQSTQSNQSHKQNTTKQPSSWNTQDLNIETNENVVIAVNILANMPANEIKQKAEVVPPASVMKAPWKYYGKIIKFTGVIGIAQEYPPGSDISNAVGGSEVGELVVTTEDMTFIDYLHIGSTGEANVGDSVTIYGYPVGIVEVQNKLGGTTQELCVVGKLIEK